MKTFRMILIIALLLTIAIPANTTLTFYNGSMYLDFSKSEKITYVAGLSDMANALTEHHEPEKYKIIRELTKDMTLGQTVLILDHYLAEHPEELHLSVAFSYLCAINEIVFEK